jgi:hypothetical protein
MASRGKPPPPAPLSILSSQLASPALSGTWLSGTWLPGTWLPGTWLPGTWLPGAELPGAELPGAELPGRAPACRRDGRPEGERCRSRAREELAIGCPHGAQAAACAAATGSKLTGSTTRQPATMTAAANTQYRRSTA